MTTTTDRSDRTLDVIDGEKYLRSWEAAQILGVHEGTLRNQRASRTSRLPFVKVDGTVYYRAREVEAATAEP
jgi:hypothetical protein